MKPKEDFTYGTVQFSGSISERARQRFEQEQAEYEQKLGRRKAKEESTGKKPGSRPPQRPSPERQAKEGK